MLRCLPEWCNVWRQKHVMIVSDARIGGVSWGRSLGQYQTIVIARSFLPQKLTVLNTFQASRLPLPTNMNL